MIFIVDGMFEKLVISAFETFPVLHMMGPKGVGTEITLWETIYRLPITRSVAESIGEYQYKSDVYIRMPVLGSQRIQFF
jgi:hypothetical protein